jgi:hypothetical protein
MALQNKKTTIPGILLIVAGVCAVGAAAMGVGDMQSAVAGLIAALTGAGFINSQDGSA